MRYLDTNNRSDATFQFFIGGRQIGKTYSALKGATERALKSGMPHMYMRLSEAEMCECADRSGRLNPYRAISQDIGIDIGFQKLSEKTYSIDVYEGEGEEREAVYNIAIAKSLVSFSNLRGVYFGDITDVIFDEFIPSEKVRKTPEIKKAGYLFANAYETINSNRELEGKEPVRVKFLANAFSLDSSILEYFGLIDVIQHMLLNEQKRYTDRERGVYIELCEAPDVSVRKKETALYRAVRGSDFETFAIDNQFRDESLNYITRDIRLSDYKPLIQYDDIVIYQRKDGAMLYAKRGIESAPYNITRRDRAQLISLFYTVYNIAIFDKTISFDSVATKLKLEHALDKSGLKI